MFRAPMLTALEFLAYIRANGDYGTVPEATRVLHISKTKLEKVASTLVKAGFLESISGKGGGYFLTSLGRDALLEDIARALDLPIFPFCPALLDLSVFEVMK